MQTIRYTGGILTVKRLIICSVLLLLLWNYRTMGSQSPVYKQNNEKDIRQFSKKFLNKNSDGEPTLKIPKKNLRMAKAIQIEEKKNSDISSNGYWVGKNATKEHVFDQSLANAILKFFQNEAAYSIIDFGAGMGLYAKTFRENEFLVSCYDGNPSTLDISEGRCAVADLSKRIDFSPHDWVLSLEVGEHIPAQYEDTFIGNLDRVNKKGIILSWAIEGQGGHGHVNNHNNSYLIEKLSKMGYDFDKDATAYLRDISRFYWFKNTIMVFRKQNSIDNNSSVGKKLINSIV